MTIGEMITDLLSTTDFGNQQIADLVKAQFPEAKTTAKSVASVASVARRYGVSIAKRPSASPTERIQELETQLAEAQRQIKVLTYLRLRSERVAA